MITPILKDPRAHGGTLYTFPSASRDLTRAFTNSEYEFVFSHFACLNLPDFKYGNFADGDLKGIYLDNICKYYDSDSDSYSILDLVSNDLNKCLKWHMQSYVMNYEVAILNGFSLNEGKYDNEILRTPSERIFFNWLQKVGAIKFSGNYESLYGYGNNYETLDSESKLDYADTTKSYIIGNKLYTWKDGQWYSKKFVSKTVQYIGSIDMVNNVNIDSDSFNEVYLNIPAGVGGSTDVYFENNVFDKNYKNGDEIDLKKDDIYCDQDDENRDYIIGRNPSKMDGKNDGTLKALYDSKYEHGTGFSSPTYKIDNGYCINFSDDRYAGGLNGMNFDSKEDFEFNCVLIYYRIRKAGGKWVTNLYGVLFLEEVTVSDYDITINNDDEVGGYIQRYPKFKNGNSWGLKLDLKIYAQPDSQLEIMDNKYDDPNGGGAGMQMFTEALMQLSDCVKLFYDVKKENTDIEERLYKLENIVSGVDTVNSLRDEVGVLRTKIEMFQPTLDSFGGRLDDVEIKISKLETNFGHLINEIKSFKTKLYNIESYVKDEISSAVSTLDSYNDKIALIDCFENRISSIESTLDNLKTNVEISDDNSLTIKI